MRSYKRRKPPSQKVRDAQDKNAASRGWIFTMSNQDGADVRRLLDLEREERVESMYVGKETSPKTGKRHLQGYVLFREHTSPQEARGLLGAPKFLVPAKAGKGKNKRYTLKDNNPLVNKN